MADSRIVIIVAAGSGTRMGAATPKQFLPLHGRPVLAHSIGIFQRALPQARILLLVQPEHMAVAGEMATSSLLPERISLVSGGRNRYESVSNGVAEIRDPRAIVFVHDGVRCLLTEDLVLRCEKMAEEKGSAVPFLPVQDSLRRRSGGSFSAVDRSEYAAIQTPQTFRADLLQQAFRQPYREAFTDEATVVESAGFPVHFLAGEEENIKLTRPVDLLTAESILTRRGAII